MGKEGGISSAVAKMPALQHSVELLKDSFVVDRRRGLADPALRLILHPGKTSDPGFRIADRRRSCTTL
jgi:hypothetical protein